MLIKIMILFLAAMAGLAMLARFWFPQARRRMGLRCTACGRPRIGPGPCPCGRQNKP
ncbi:hypothetical protein [Paenirhodobacter sp.]|uniref:hypothetical protein n=1 Tax=Paenirhodobacter sp. TaxID=1965326 RepID=UPI003B513401